MLDTQTNLVFADGFHIVNIIHIIGMSYPNYNQGFTPNLPVISNEIRLEIQRFESVHPSIYAIYDLIEGITDPRLQAQIRDHVVSIEGE